MSSMQIFDLELRISGSVQNTVPMIDVTASEVAVLREIHGPDAITNIRYVWTRDVDGRTVYDELTRKFRKAEYAKLLVDLFGLPANPRMIVDLKGLGLEDTQSKEAARKEADELEMAKIQLTEMGVKFGPRIGLDKAKALLAEHSAKAPAAKDKKE